MQISLRSPSTQKWIILLTVAFGLTYAYANFLYVPRKELAIRLSNDIQSEAEVLAKGKRIAAHFQTVQDDYDRLYTSWRVAHELLPTRQEMEALLKSVTLCGQENDVEFLLFKPLEPAERAYYWEHPIQVKTLSSYHDLGHFISAVASLERIVNVNNLRLVAHKPKRGRSPATVEAEFVATIYIFKELGAPVTVESVAAAKDKGKPGKNKAKPPAAPSEAKRGGS